MTQPKFIENDERLRKLITITRLRRQLMGLILRSAVEINDIDMVQLKSVLLELNNSRGTE